MKGIASKIPKALPSGARLLCDDNSGAKIARITGVKGGKSRKGRQVGAGIADLVKISVRKGLPEMKGVLFDAVIIRQRREWRRANGERICFADNAVALLKDEKNPKGTMIRGAVAREVAERWPAVSKIAAAVI